MKILKLLLLVLLLRPAGSAMAQSDDRVITPAECHAYVAQHGVPDADPVTTFQGGSLEAQVVAFCQSLAYRGERDGVELDQKFTALADRDQNGTIDLAEMEAYFTAAPSSEVAESAPQPEAPELPATGADARGVSLAAVALVCLLAAVLIVAGARMVRRPAR